MTGARSRTGTVIIAAVGRLNLAVFYLIGAMMATMCVFALLQVTVRLVLTAFGINLSVPWSEEVGRYLMIWAIFLGTAYACRSAQMIALNFIIDRMPALLQRLADLAIAVVCVAFFLLLMKVGWDLMQFGWIERSPVLRIHKAYVYAAMPIGAGLMILNTLVVLFERGMFSPNYQRQAVTASGPEPGRQRA